MTNIIYLASAEETEQYGARLANAITGGAVIFLEGHLGVGKTTLARGFLRGLGYTGRVKSPTYTLVEPYELENYSVFHFDFYRLEDPKELEHIGLQEYFFDTAISLIEWPEKAFPLLPEPDLICRLSIKEPGRNISMVSQTQIGVKILERLSEVHD